MKGIKLTVFALLGAIIVPFGASAQQIPTLDFFHGRECPHCQNQKKWLPKLQEAYPDLVINEYEVWHDTENEAIWAARLAELGETPSGVPSNIIGEMHITGFSPDRILVAMEANYGPPAVDISTIETTKEEGGNQNLVLIISLFVAVGIGLGIAFIGRKSA